MTRRNLFKDMLERMRDDGTLSVWPLSQETVDSIGDEAAKVMYENGYCDDWGGEEDPGPDFNPVIPNVNLKVEVDEHKRSVTLTHIPDHNLPGISDTIFC